MEEVQQTQPQLEQPIHDFNAAGLKFSIHRKHLIVFAVAIVLGTLSGFFLSQNKLGTVVGTSGSLTSIGKGTIVGSLDTKTFKDQTEGILKVGGIGGEGAFHLVRPGGDSQNVYLTSSIVDLGSFVDRKIRVWGQTQKAQHAGWLMDVGRIEVLE